MRLLNLASTGISSTDEGLKELIHRLIQDPNSTFVEVAANLTSRGHAAEALQITEWGIQRQPDSADGRAERAAALLKLRRPLPAYVELRRALAIDPNHRRALRLLGRTYKQVGAPERAAALLIERDETGDSHENLPTSINFPASQEISSPATSLEAAEPLLSKIVRNAPLEAQESQPKAEVTQIIRQRTNSTLHINTTELSAIEGPIVDNTQPIKAKDFWEEIITDIRVDPASWLANIDSDTVVDENHLKHAIGLQHTSESLALPDHSSSLSLDTVVDKHPILSEMSQAPTSEKEAKTSYYLLGMFGAFIALLCVAALFLTFAF